MAGTEQHGSRDKQFPTTIPGSLAAISGDSIIETARQEYAHRGNLDTYSQGMTRMRVGRGTTSGEHVVTMQPTQHAEPSSANTEDQHAAASRNIPLEYSTIREEDEAGRYGIENSNGKPPQIGSLFDKEGVKEGMGTQLAEPQLPPHQLGRQLTRTLSRATTGLSTVTGAGVTAAQYVFAKHPVEKYRSSVGLGSHTGPPTMVPRLRKQRTRPQEQSVEEWKQSERQVRLKAMAKRSKHKPYRQRFYAALKRLYHRSYDPTPAGAWQHTWDRILVASIQSFEWWSQFDILTGHWVLAVLAIELVLWATWGFMAGSYALFSLQQEVVKLQDTVEKFEVDRNLLQKYTDTGVEELWRWLRSQDWREFSTSYVLEWGALHLPSMMEASGTYRWFTSCLLHIDSIHLLINSSILLFLGSIVEYRFGPSRLLILCILSALAGNVLQGSVGDACDVTVGFSGAIFGLVAFNLSDLTLNRENHAHVIIKLVSVLEVVAVFVVQSVFLDNVRHWAHIGGFLQGLMMASLYLPTTGFELLDASLPTLITLLQAVWFVVLPVIVYRNVIPEADCPPVP